MQSPAAHAPRSGDYSLPGLSHALGLPGGTPTSRPRLLAPDHIDMHNLETRAAYAQLPRVASPFGQTAAGFAPAMSLSDFAALQAANVDSKAAIDKPEPPYNFRRRVRATLPPVADDAPAALENTGTSGRAATPSSDDGAKLSAEKRKRARNVKAQRTFRARQRVRRDALNESHANLQVQVANLQTENAELRQQVAELHRQLNHERSRYAGSFS